MLPPSLLQAADRAVRSAMLVAATCLRMSLAGCAVFALTQALSRTFGRGHLCCDFKGKQLARVALEPVTTVTCMLSAAAANNSCVNESEYAGR